MPKAIIKASIFPALSKVKELFDNWILPSIESCYQATKNQKNGTPLVAYILLSCAIDVIAGFYCGRISLKEKGLGAQYKEFIQMYLKKYNSKKVYEFIRCSLVHNFIIGPNMALTHGNSRVHLITQNGVDFKNFENFFEDFKMAVRKYFEDLESSEELQIKFLDRYTKLGIPGIRNFQINSDQVA